MLVWWVRTSIHFLVAMPLIVLPATLTSAHLEPVSSGWASSEVFFENPNACVWAGMAPAVCQAGYRAAYRQHVRIAPTYRELADCEADFTPGECFAADVSRLWSPWLSGFAIITQVQLTSTGGSPDSQVRLFSEPLYRGADHRGGTRLISLREKLHNGEHFDKAFIRHRRLQAGSTAADQRLARTFEPQRLFYVSKP
ncbi:MULTISPECIES: DUF1190 domain-containing protein [Pseudomonas]|nr:MULTISPECIES: DUF1190 domain-containing protein [Pseudomonas]RZI67250.1 MAG: DUF1190 domain-containing protein [Pseudomonas sp.]